MATEQNSTHTPTFIKMTADGQFEYGVVRYGKDRRRDKLEVVGASPNYGDAATRASAIAKAVQS